MLISVDVENELPNPEEDSSLEELRSDLSHQLSIPDDLDWDYFLITALRAKRRADVDNINKPLKKSDR